MNTNVHVQIRKAVSVDIPVLRDLIVASVLGLQSKDYTTTQLEGALKTVYGVDSKLITEGTYFVAEAGTLEPEMKNVECERVIVGCGGWSKRKTLYGGDRWTKREDDLLDPLRDTAKIRAFFIHPAWARRGIGSMILEACEAAARAAGFERFEMEATLSGVPMYRAREYVELEPLDAVTVNIVCFRFRPRAEENGDALNKEIMLRLQERGDCRGLGNAHSWEVCDARCDD
jgi:GNAT superfamily N-acetyltransferase